VSGSRELVVPPERLERWLTGFAERHGLTQSSATPNVVTVVAADGSIAECHVPFAPLPCAMPNGDDSVQFCGLVTHANVDRRVGVVLVRRGGYAAGVFEGRRLVTSKVGSRHVQGRSAAGGQSQQRFARRRDKQAREAFEAAADVAVRILTPHLPGLDAVITGGDRSAIDHVLADRRLVGVRDLVVPPHLPVPDPKLAVLKASPDEFRAVRIVLTESA
jgi:hypothetical protein